MFRKLALIAFTTSLFTACITDDEQTSDDPTIEDRPADDRTQVPTQDDGIDLPPPCRAGKFPGTTECPTE